MQDHFPNASERRERVQNFRPKTDVRLHGLPLFGIERAVFVENAFRDSNLADVVEHRAEANFFHFGLAHPERLGDERGIGGHLLGMALRVMILGVNRVGQRSDRVQHGLRKRMRALLRRDRSAAVIGLRGAERFRELPQTLVNFLKSLGTRGEKALESDAQVSLEDVALPLLGFVGIKVIGGGDGVAALMLRKVHRSVGDLDELLRRGAVQRVAGDAKARADVFLAQQRIGGNPAAQLAGELAGVLHGGFRHQNDKFVAPVARDDVGAATVGLQNLTHALEHEVAFEVAVKVVDEFEAVQIHEHQREGTASARGALPFRGERFHEETMRLDTGEAIGDGLLLRFLKRKRVMQRAGDEVGKGAEQQDFLLREVHWRGGLDVENAVKLLGILYVESATPVDFSEEEVLLLRTLADLIAGALHNALSFQKAQEQAITDGLTGVKTHRFFMEALSSEWKRSTRAGRSFALVLMDLDRFKFVNDFYGHLEGDLVLQRVGQILETN